MPIATSPLAHTVQVVPGATGNVQLPNGVGYTATTTVRLTEDQFQQIAPAVISSGLVVDLGSDYAVATPAWIASRTVLDGVTNSTVLVTSATLALTQADKGLPISATGIPANDTIAVVSSPTNLNLAVAATASAASLALTVGTIPLTNNTSGNIRVRKQGDVVQLSGTGARASSSGAIFTLPVGYRPPATVVVVGASCTFSIASTGVVTPSIATGTYNFDGVEFATT